MKKTELKLYQARINDDILDPYLRSPIAHADGFTVSFPKHWTTDQRKAWRETYVREEWLKARGKD